MSRERTRYVLWKIDREVVFGGIKEVDRVVAKIHYLWQALMHSLRNSLQIWERQNKRNLLVFADFVLVSSIQVIFSSQVSEASCALTRDINTPKPPKHTETDLCYNSRTINHIRKVNESVFAKKAGLVAFQPAVKIHSLQNTDSKQTTRTCPNPPARRELRM